MDKPLYTDKYVNALDEEILDKTKVHYYIIPKEGKKARLETYEVDFVDDPQSLSHSEKNGYTAVGLNPASALLLLHDYYECYGYPEERD
jgi:hypothetical protein